MNVLAFFAHPDDETMLAGGLLALLAKTGVFVHILCATRGEGGDLGEPPYKREILGMVREQELTCAARALGVTSLSFLDYIDPTVGPDDQLFSFTQDLDKLAGDLTGWILELKADVLLTHGSNGEYGHPAHITIYNAAHLAVEKLSADHPIYWYGVQGSYAEHPRTHLMNPDDPANWMIDVRPVIPEKVAAAKCHLTQNPLFLRRVSEILGRPIALDEVVMDSESYHRVSPKNRSSQNDPLMDHLYSTGLLKLLER